MKACPFLLLAAGTLGRPVAQQATATTTTQPQKTSENGTVVDGPRPQTEGLVGISAANNRGGCVRAQRLVELPADIQIDPLDLGYCQPHTDKNKECVARVKTVTISYNKVVQCGCGGANSSSISTAKGIADTFSSSEQLCRAENDFITVSNDARGNDITINPGRCAGWCSNAVDNALLALNVLWTADKSAEAWVDGQPLAGLQRGGWRYPSQQDFVSGRAGTHVVAIKATAGAARAPAGVLAALTVMNSDMTVPTGVASWRATTTQPSGDWLRADFADDTWQAPDMCPDSVTTATWNATTLQPLQSKGARWVWTAGSRCEASTAGEVLYLRYKFTVGPGDAPATCAPTDTVKATAKVLVVDSCRPLCKNVTTCTADQFFNRNTCECECRIEPTCAEGADLNTDTCSCVCLRDPKECPAGLALNNATCACEPVCSATVQSECMKQQCSPDTNVNSTTWCVWRDNRCRCPDNDCMLREAQSAATCPTKSYTLEEETKKCVWSPFLNRCDMGCTLQASDCQAANGTAALLTPDYDNCTCACPLRPTDCQAPKVLDSSTCQCVCSAASTCPLGTVLVRTDTGCSCQAACNATSQSECPAMDCPSSNATNTRACVWLGSSCGCAANTCQNNRDMDSCISGGCVWNPALGLCNTTCAANGTCIDIAPGKGPQACNLACQAGQVLNTTSCECVALCDASKATCQHPFSLNTTTCMCQCNTTAAQADQCTGPGLVFDSAVCACKCNLTDNACPAGMALNTDRCECQPACSAADEATCVQLDCPLAFMANTASGARPRGQCVWREGACTCPKNTCQMAAYSSNNATCGTMLASCRRTAGQACVFTPTTKTCDCECRLTERDCPGTFIPDRTKCQCVCPLVCPTATHVLNAERCKCVPKRFATTTTNPPKQTANPPTPPDVKPDQVPAPQPLPPNNGNNANSNNGNANPGNDGNVNPGNNASGNNANVNPGNNGNVNPGNNGNSNNGNVNPGNNGNVNPGNNGNSGNSGNSGIPNNGNNMHGNLHLENNVLQAAISRLVVTTTTQPPLPLATIVPSKNPPAANFNTAPAPNLPPQVPPPAPMVPQNPTIVVPPIAPLPPTQAAVPVSPPTTTGAIGSLPGINPIMVPPATTIATTATEPTTTTTTTTTTSEPTTTTTTTTTTTIEPTTTTSTTTEPPANQSTDSTPVGNSDAAVR